MDLLKRPVDRRLWLATLIAILGIVVVGIIVARSLPSHTASPIGMRLAAAVIVTAFVAAAKLLVGPRAAAVAGILGTLLAVIVLIVLA